MKKGLIITLSIILGLMTLRDFRIYLDRWRRTGSFDREW